MLNWRAIGRGSNIHGHPSLEGVVFSVKELSQQYLGSSEVARLFQVSPRNASRGMARCFDGRSWKGMSLEVKMIPGKGGKCGARYEASLSSLSRYLPSTSAVKVTSETSSLNLPPAHFDLHKAMRSILTAGPSGSRERARAIGLVSEQLNVSARTVRLWLSDFQTKGLLAFSKGARADKGKSRVKVSRLWDAATADLATVTQQQLANEISNKVRSFWASGGTTVSNIIFMMARHVRSLTESAGVTLTEAEWDRVCLLPADFIGTSTRRRAALAHMKRTDAGGYASKKLGRIRRDRSKLLPMEMVAGDVRHSDIMVLRPDGTLATPKMVCFLDLATNRLFTRVFLLPKGEMIRREHVLMTLRDMMADPLFGVPQCLYFDNGGEFMIGLAANDLANLVSIVRDATKIEIGIFDWEEAERRLGILRALPLRPQSKVIEGIFSTLTRSIEPLSDGFIGGNRMAKKVANQGKAPIPFAGDEAKIIQHFGILVDFYNAKPQQKGHIKGLSPIGAFNALVDRGWQSVLFEAPEFELAFGKEEVRKVQAGGEIQIDNRFYSHKNLATRVGETVRIRVPMMGDKRLIPVLDGASAILCVAAEVPVYTFNDLAGAKESGRRIGLTNRAVREEAADTERLNMAAEMAATVKIQPKSRVPKVAATVSLDPLLREAANTQAPPKVQSKSNLQRLASAAMALNEAARRAG